LDDGGIGFGPLSAALQNWLPVVWPTLWPILLGLAATWGFGAAIARRDRAAS
jgi:hypothetical protein